jgi:hypothetical protein
MTSNPYLYLALAHGGLARVMRARGQLQSAEAGLRRALAMLEAALRPNHRYALAMRRELAQALAAQHRQAPADSVARPSRYRTGVYNRF